MEYYKLRNLLFGLYAIIHWMQALFIFNKDRKEMAIKIMIWINEKINLGKGNKCLIP